MSEKLIINLWERMGHIYGHKFVSVYGDSAIIGNELSEVAKTWLSGLRDVTGEQIAKGLRECIDCGESWPPTLPDFARMCKGKIKNEHGLNYTPEIYRANVQIFTAKKFKQEFLEDQKKVWNRLTNEK